MAFENEGKTAYQQLITTSLEEITYRCESEYVFSANFSAKRPPQPEDNHQKQKKSPVSAGGGLPGRPVMLLRDFDAKYTVTHVARILLQKAR